LLATLQNDLITHYLKETYLEEYATRQSSSEEENIIKDDDIFCVKILSTADVLGTTIAFVAVAVYDSLG